MSADVMGIGEGWAGQVAFARNLLKLLKDQAPRDGGGNLVKPYKGWVAELERSVKDARGWEESSQGKGAQGG